VPIAISEIEPGWLYRTARGQERLILGRDIHGRVIYASRGGNVLSPFRNQRATCSAASFAKKCESKVRQVSNLESYIRANSAGAVITKDGPPFGPKDQFRRGKCKVAGCPCGGYNGKGTGICFTFINTTFPPGRCGHSEDEHEAEVL
jgi:hypothetical protein